jgi:2'-5' RNA ligase
MRLFIAVPVPDNVRDHLRQLLADLKKSRADYKWVEPENLHLTMSFLGETDPGRIAALESVLKESVGGRSAFTMAFGAIGAFDSLDRPRVLWVGMTEGASELKELAARLNQELLRAGFPCEGREFKPHLTIARMRTTRNLENLRARLGHWSDPSRLAHMHAPVDRLVLYESRLSSKGPTYFVVKEASLRG